MPPAPSEGSITAAVSPYTIVRLTCRATVNGQLCGGVLGDVPGPVVHVGLAARAPERLDGLIRLKCSRKDCRTWNLFRVVTPSSPRE